VDERVRGDLQKLALAVQDAPDEPVEEGVTLGIAVANGRFDERRDRAGEVEGSRAYLSQRERSRRRSRPGEGLRSIRTDLAPHPDAAFGVARPLPLGEVGRAPEQACLAPNRPYDLIGRDPIRD
jgi:hypothetical protein